MNYDGAVVGLGNPGPDYAGTRHNCGFALIETLLEYAGREGRVDDFGGSKFHCLLWRIQTAKLGTWLAAMPQTYMNESGRSVQPLLAWHKIEPGKLVVAHDEMDIPVGELRFKLGGGNAGHNGLKSITSMLGNANFMRLRIGIGRPKERSDVLGWVLGRPRKEDGEKIAMAVRSGLDVLLAYAENGKNGLQAATTMARTVKPAIQPQG